MQAYIDHEVAPRRVEMFIKAFSHSAKPVPLYLNPFPSFHSFGTVPGER
jgi:hypothetical protein